MNPALIAAVAAAGAALYAAVKSGKITAPAPVAQLIPSDSGSGASGGASSTGLPQAPSGLAGDTTSGDAGSGGSSVTGTPTGDGATGTFLSPRATSAIAAEAPAAEAGLLSGSFTGGDTFELVNGAWLFNPLSQGAKDMYGSPQAASAATGVSLNDWTADPNTGGSYTGPRLAGGTTDVRNY